MRPLHLIPLSGLAVVLVVAGLALRDAPPVEAEFGAPPARTDLPAPELESGEAALRGRLLGADGSPVEGATLVVVQGGRPLWTFTSGDGTFRLEEVRPGPLRLAAHAPGHMPRTFEASAGDAPVVLRMSDTLSDPPRLPDPEPADLEGRIVAPGQDLAGCEVALLPTAAPTEPGTGVPRRTICETGGRFRFEALTPARYELLLLPPWAVGATWPDLLTPLSAPPLRIEHPSREELRLPLGTGTIEGRTFDEGGRPLVGALVVATPNPESPETTARRHVPPTRTDGEGTFRLELLPPGLYTVTLTAGEDRRRAEVEVVAGGVSDPDF